MSIAEQRDRTEQQQGRRRLGDDWLQRTRREDAKPRLATDAVARWVAALEQPEGDLHMSHHSSNTVATSLGAGIKCERRGGYFTKGAGHRAGYGRGRLCPEAVRCVEGSRKRLPIEADGGSVLLGDCPYRRSPKHRLLVGLLDVGHVDKLEHERIVAIASECPGEVERVMVERDSFARPPVISRYIVPDDGLRLGRRGHEQGQDSEGGSHCSVSDKEAAGARKNAAQAGELCRVSRGRLATVNPFVRVARQRSVLFRAVIAAALLFYAIDGLFGANPAMAQGTTTNIGKRPSGSAPWFGWVGSALLQNDVPDEAELATITSQFVRQWGVVIEPPEEEEEE